MPTISPMSIPEYSLPESTFLRASFSLRGGKTEAIERYHTAPVKIAKLFRFPDELGVIVMDSSPGMLGNDRYVMEWEAGQDTRVVLTNQSFTKVHPCEYGQKASMLQRFRLGSGSCIEVMMEPVMLYRDAAYENDTVVELQKGSVWMQGEVLCPGRILRGESFVYRRLDNRLRVYSEGRLIFHQRQVVLPEQQAIEATGSWEDFSHTGTFYVFSDGVTPKLLEDVRQALQKAPSRLGTEILSCASLTYTQGLVVTGYSKSAWILQELLKEVWSEVRKSLLGLPPLHWYK
ncbi:urease accessory protein UreD [Paenibacillus sp. HN-1]|uniref:urease accessory protein UreD n=2 Tax=Paenibacillus TaxID=44249 RepID=UPI001CAA1AFC|nr:urease accessory protein UreD [Paenibacillus sp. CGMCC 1.18879]MBY9077693.1 urease accessory protein UreD [Paenibacillus sp. CGMCC 1.18879]MBY9083728.1 urease accessory protein UreD [Paenibacillus sinensis]